MSKKLLIELPYLGNIAYYQYIVQFDEVTLEKQENFVKATYRNRCEIASPNGILTLSVPVKGGRGKRQLYTQVEIAHDHDWRKNHWQGLCSCYRSSPYFEFYEDEFKAIYDLEINHLFELNEKLFLLIHRLLGAKQSIKFTEEFIKKPKDVVDARGKFLPKYGNQLEKEIDYIQVFSSKTGFFSNLTILDLLFNEGPNSLNLLQ